MTDAEFLCPNCGKDLPAAMGQHSTDLLSALVTCPHCGAQVTLREGAVESPSPAFEEAAAAPPGRTEDGDTFAGSETFDGLTEELRDKTR
jgi:predicted RNA-binding Zn-ribbon protein involved in translation (DUF1610 family)